MFDYQLVFGDGCVYFILRLKHFSLKIILIHALMETSKFIFGVFKKMILIGSSFANLTTNQDWILLVSGGYLIICY